MPVTTPHRTVPPIHAGDPHAGDHLDMGESALGTPLHELVRQFTLAADHRNRLNEVLKDYGMWLQEWEHGMRNLKEKMDRSAFDDSNSMAAEDEKELNAILDPLLDGDGANGEDACDVRPEEDNVLIESGADFENFDPMASRYQIWSHETDSKRNSGSLLVHQKTMRLSETDYGFCSSTSELAEQHAETRCQCKQLDGLVLNPTGNTRIIWDLLSMIIVVYDLIALPLMVFGYDYEVMRIITMVFWTCDIVMSFFTGFQKDNGHSEMRFLIVAVQYLKTRFIFDAVISGVDWTLFFGNQGNLAAIARIGKSARMTRAMRLLRIMRLARLKSLMNNSHNHVASATLFSFLNILRLMFGVVILNHFFACGWYGLAVLQDDDTEKLKGTWAETLSQDPATSRYLAAYSWSLAQFTPSSNEHLPATAIERLYALVMLFIGLVVYSAFLGNVTAIVNDARKKAYAAMVQGQMLRTFIAENNISLVLSRSITHFFRENRARSQKVLELDIPMLQHLPRHLREELHYELHSPIIGVHALFEFIFNNFRSSGLNLCHAAASERSLSKGEEPFYFQKKAVSMLFPISGKLDYFVGPGSAQLFSKKPVRVSPGEWVTEAPLWMEWEHRGLLSVGMPCDVLELDSYNFRKAVAHHDHAITQFKAYATLYAKAMAEAMEKDVDIDDLWGTPSGTKLEFLDASKLDELLSSM